MYVSHTMFLWEPLWIVDKLSCNFCREVTCHPAIWLSEGDFFSGPTPYYAIFATPIHSTVGGHLFLVYLLIQKNNPTPLWTFSRHIASALEEV